MPLTTNADALPYFVDHLTTKTGAGASTATAYANDMRRFFLSYGPQVEIMNDLAPSLLQWVDGLRRSDRSAAYVRRCRAAARAFLRFHGQSDSVFADYKMPPLPEPDPHPIEGGVEAVVAMVSKEQDPRVRMAIALGGFAGTRVSESLHVSPIAFDPNFTRLTVYGKGEKYRTVPVSSRLRAHATSYVWTMHPQSAAYVDLPYSTARAAITAAGEAVGLKGVSSHDLRATFATEAFEKSGHNLLLVSRLLGHASVVTTQRYIHTAGAVDAVEF